MKDSAFRQALPRLLPALAVVLLLGSCGLLRSKEKIARALAGVEKARNELAQARLDAAAAEGKRAKAASELSYVEEQARTQDDQEGAAWWQSQALDKDRELQQATRMRDRAEFELRRLGRDYLQAELAYKKAAGRFRDSELAREWQARLASEAKQPPPEPASAEKKRFFAYGAAFLGVLVILVLLITRPAWLRLGRKLGGGSGLPAIQVRAAPAPEKPKEPQVLAGRYKLDVVIGHGGMGRVWIGKDVNTGLQVAVKQMAVIEGVEAYSMRELYRKESRTLEALHHPNIVRLIETVDGDDGLFLVFEYLTGKTLLHLLAERKRFTWGQARDIFVPVAQALGFAHSKGVIHRDIKPQNIMVTDAGLVKVMDFGLVKTVGAAQAGTPAPGASYAPGAAGSGIVPAAAPASPLPAPTPLDLMTAKTKTMAGTPTYMCPEAARGIVSPAYDVFSLGVCLYQCLTGGLPFGYTGWTPMAAMKYIPPGVLVTGLDRRLDGLVAGMLEADLAKRIPSCEELIRRMNELPAQP